MVVGTKVLIPTTSPDVDPPQVATGEQVEQPPVFAPPSNDSTNAREYTLYNTLPGFIAYKNIILVGEVTGETDIEIPPTEDQWATYEASQTPPPPDHPKAQGRKPPAPPMPTPAKLFTIKVTEGIKGITSGETVTMQQPNVTYANAGPEPVLQVGGTYMLFPSRNDRGLYEVGAPYVTIAEDSLLRVISLPQTTGAPGYLRELDGVALAEGLRKIRFAVRAETAIRAALAKVEIEGAFARFVGSQGGCVSVGTNGRTTATYESAVWPKAAGANEVKLTRRVRLEGTDHETTWTFQVQPDGSVDGPVRSGSDLEASPCAPVR